MRFLLFFSCIRYYLRFYFYTSSGFSKRSCYTYAICLSWGKRVDCEMKLLAFVDLLLKLFLSKSEYE